MCKRRSYVGDLVAEKNLLPDPRIEDLAIINLGELEMLEGCQMRSPSNVAGVLVRQLGALPREGVFTW